MSGPFQPEKQSLFSWDLSGVPERAPFRQQTWLTAESLGQVGLLPFLGCPALEFWVWSMENPCPQQVLYRWRVTSAPATNFLQWL